MSERSKMILAGGGGVVILVLILNERLGLGITDTTLAAIAGIYGAIVAFMKDDGSRSDHRRTPRRRETADRDGEDS